MLAVHGWSRALDVQMDQQKWQREEMGIQYTLSFFADFLDKKGDEDYRHDLPGIARDATALTHSVMVLLNLADTIFLTRDMQHIILQAAHDLPEEAEFDFRTFITPCGFCMFEETVYGKDRIGLTIGVSAMAWNLAPIQGEPHEALMLYFFTSTDDMEDDVNREVMPRIRARGDSIGPLALCHWYPALEGARIPAAGEPGTELVTGLLKLFVAMNLIAQQKIGEPMQMRPTRAQRRRIERDPNYPHPDKRITLITLRRKSVKHDDEPKEIVRTHRWLVRGHWRRQWYPSTKRHEWKYIYEYVKGPEDKPLLITERRVFNFRR
jgi:hypothetical protein